MKLYLVGPQKDNIMDSTFQNTECSLLMSYINKRAAEKFMNLGNIFIDSGAFTAWTKGAKINVKEYINWLNEHSDYIRLCGQVDVIPGDRVFGATPEEVRDAAQNTWDNYLFMRKRMKKPESLLYTFHVGEPIEFLRQALEWRDDKGESIPYIALGGMVGKSKKVRDSFLEKCFNTIKTSSNPDIKVHAFGMTDFDLLEKYPVESADSTSWIMTGAMGSIMSDYGTLIMSNQQRGAKSHWSNLPPAAQEVLKKTTRAYEFTLEELAESADCRILYNAFYMNDKVKELNSKKREYKITKKLF